MSLRARFVTASSLVALLTSSGASAAVWFAYGATQEHQLDAALLFEATDDALDVASGQPRGAGLVLRHRDIAPSDAYAAVYDGAGTALAWTPNLAAAQPRMDAGRRAFAAPFDLWWNNRHLRAVWAPVSGAGGESLLLAAARTDLDEDATLLARRMAGAAIVGVLAAAAATAWLARFLTRDHERIAAVARSVAAGNLSARIGGASTDPEVARLARDVDEMISRLALLVETQQRFIASASHELRSPVTTMLGELSFALRRERDAPSYRQAIEEALDSARRLKHVTEDLLALARVGATEIEPRAVVLGDVARAAVKAAGTDAQAAGIRVEASCDEAMVDGSADDLQRMIRNLVENAIRHSHAGGCVRVDVTRGNETASLSVRDDGPGVPEEARERIFEPFYRLPSDRAHHGGAGLGLAIARSIARAHRGELRVEASPSGVGGACFVARLPLAVAGAGA